MKILVVLGLLFLISYLIGRFAIKKRLLSEKLVNYSNLPTFSDFIKAGFILTMFIVFIIIMIIILIVLAVRFLIVAIPVGVILILIYLIYLGYHFFKK